MMVIYCVLMGKIDDRPRHRFACDVRMLFYAMFLEVKFTELECVSRHCIYVYSVLLDEVSTARHHRFSLERHPQLLVRHLSIQGVSISFRVGHTSNAN
jgi:hypothetical protein